MQRNLKFVRYLPDFGYRSTVVTGPGPSADRWTPVDPTMSDEVPEGTEICRLPEMSQRVSRWRSRAERWLGTETAWSRWWTPEALRLSQDIGDADVVYASLVPYESTRAAEMIAADLGKPLVIDLQDPWALDEMWVYPSELHRQLDLRRMRRSLGRAAAIIMNTPDSCARVLERFPELRSKLVVSIPNGFDSADFASEPATPRRDGTFRIVHTGYLHTELGRSHRRTARLKRLVGGATAGVDILTRSHVYLLEAIRSLIAEEPELESIIELHLAGVLTETDRDAAGGHSVVRMLGYLSHRETVALMRSADLLFLPMHNLPPGRRAGIVPGKTYEYMASAGPILAAVPDGDARDLLLEVGSGLLSRPDDVDAMAEHLRRQLERWRRGEPSPLPDEAVLARFERRALTEQLASVFDELCASRSSRRARERSVVS